MSNYSTLHSLFEMQNQTEVATDGGQATWPVSAVDQFDMAYMCTLSTRQEVYNHIQSHALQTGEAQFHFMAYQYAFLVDHEQKLCIMRDEILNRDS